MWRWASSLGLAALLAAPALAGAAESGEGAERLYRENCAVCHGADRLGGTGPALLPESLARLGGKRAKAVIAEGRVATQMPGFGAALSGAEIDSLVDLILSDPPTVPAWGLAEIAASRVILAQPDELVAKPVYEADPLRLFVVVESGDHHVTVLDGDRLEPITRFPSRYALHGGPKFSPDGRFVYFASRDGWITKYDLWGLETVAEVRAGINTRNLAISDDGTVVAVANYLPRTLVLLDADDLAPLELVPARDLRGQQDSRVSAVYTAPQRGSFVVAFKDIPEIWEVAYSATARRRVTGFAHSYETGREEVLASAERFPLRRIELEAPLDDFFFGPDYRVLLGAAREGEGARVVNLDVGRAIAKLPLEGLPHLGSGITWDYQGRRVMATPHLKQNAISVIDMDDWSLVKRIETLGPGFFMRSHENTRYAWADVFFGPDRDAVHVIDKQTLEIVATLRPAPGKTAAHVEFTHDGRYALVSIWERDGAIVVYDAETLREVKRIPMVKPSGKYNVYNKITRSEGTSH